MKNPSVPSVSGARRTGASASQRGGRARNRRRRPRTRPARSCTPSRPASPPGAGGGGPAARMRACWGASSAIRSGLVRQRRSGRDWSVPRPLHGGSTSTRSNTSPGRGARRVGGLHGGRADAASAPACAAAPRRGRGGAPPPPARPRRPASAARCVVLARARRTGRARARRAAGASARATAIDARDWGMSSPALPLGRGVGVKGGLEDEPLGEAGRGRGVARPAAPPHRPPTRRSVLTRIADSAGCIDGGQQRPRPVGARARPTTARPATRGTECRTAAPAGVSSLSPPSSSRPSRSARRSTALTRPLPARAWRLASSTDSCTAA